MAHKQVNIRIDLDAWNNFVRNAEAEHLDPNRFVALLVSKFGDLRTGEALTALTSIPAHLYKARPGRPQKTAPTDTQQAVAAA